MIENLHATYETVNYKQDTHLKLHNNHEYEDYPPHWHTSIEIILPMEHEYYAQIDNTIYVLRPGDLLFIWPGVVHELKAPPKGHRFFFQAELSVIKDIKEVNSVLSFLGSASLFTPENAPDIYSQLHALVLEACEEYLTGNNLFEAVIYSKLISMFVLIGRHHLSSLENGIQNQGKQQEYLDNFIDVCDYINQHFTEDLTLDQMAAMAGFSKYHFSRLFKQFTNVSFYKYVNQKRIEHAQSLIVNPDISILDVAMQSGFSTPSAFIRMFKIFNGCTPTEYRKISRLIND